MRQVPQPDRFIDILRKANARAPLRVEMELSGQKCWLHFPNRHKIVDIQEKIYRIAYAEAADLGLVGKPINEAEWTALEALAKTSKQKKPTDLAEQYAQHQSTMQSVYNLIPALVRDEQGEELFPTLEEKRAFLDMLRDDVELEAYVLGKWNELFKTREEVTAEVKNE